MMKILKKPAALLCALVLTLSSPATAFGNDFGIFRPDYDSGPNFTVLYMPTEYDGAIFSNFTTIAYGGNNPDHLIISTRTDEKGQVVTTTSPRTATGVSATAVPKPYPIEAYKVLHAVAFKVACRYTYSDNYDIYTDWIPVNECPVPEKYCRRSLSFDFQFTKETIDDLCKAHNVKDTDLRLMVYEKYVVDNKIKMLYPVSDNIPVTAEKKIEIGPNDTASGTVVLAVVDPNAQPPEPDPSPVDPKPSKPKPNNATKVDSGSDSSTSGWRDIQVVGSSDVAVQGNLNGANVADSDNAYVSVKRLTSGSAFDELRATADGDNLDKAFDVALYVNGKEVHSDFGRLRISFAVGTQYNGRKAIVWHRHNDGQLTSQDTWVIDGDVTVEVTDLSEFGIDIEGVSTAATQVDDSTTSPKTGQNIPAGTAPLALAVAGALGTMALIASHRRAR